MRTERERERERVHVKLSYVCVSGRHHCSTNHLQPYSECRVFLKRHLKSLSGAGYNVAGTDSG